MRKKYFSDLLQISSKPVTHTPILSRLSRGNFKVALLDFWPLGGNRTVNTTLTYYDIIKLLWLTC